MGAYQTTLFSSNSQRSAELIRSIGSKPPQFDEAKKVLESLLHDPDATKQIDVDYENEHGESALDAACRRRQPELVTLILALQPSPRVKLSTLRATCYSRAELSNEDFAIIDALLRAPTCPSVERSEMVRIVNDACRHGDAQTLALFLHHAHPGQGGHPAAEVADLQDDLGNTPLMVAMDNHQMRCVRLLLDRTPTTLAELGLRAGIGVHKAALQSAAPEHEDEKSVSTLASSPIPFTSCSSPLSALSSPFSLSDSPSPSESSSPLSPSSSSSTSAPAPAATASPLPPLDNDRIICDVNQQNRGGRTALMRGFCGLARIHSRMVRRRDDDVIEEARRLACITAFLRAAGARVDLALQDSDGLTAFQHACRFLPVQTALQIFATAPHFDAEAALRSLKPDGAEQESSADREEVIL